MPKVGFVLWRIAHNLGIDLTALSPLGALSYLELDMAGAKESVLEQALVKAVATPVIPKTARPKRLTENLAIFDFTVSDAEMTAIDELNYNGSVFPSVVVNDGSVTTLEQSDVWIKQNLTELEAKLRRYYFAVFHLIQLKPLISFKAPLVTPILLTKHYYQIR